METTSAFRERYLLGLSRNEPLNELTDEYSRLPRGGGGGGYTQMPDFYVLFASKHRPVCDFIIQIWEVTFHFSNDRNLTLFNISLISLSSD